MECSEEKKQEALETYKSIDAERIDGVNYQRWFSPDPPTVVYDRMKKTKLRASDVITTGFPRSGNHWTYEVMHMILKQTTNFPEISFVENFWDMRDETLYGALDDLPSPRQLCTHTRPRRFPPNAFELGCKMVFIIRNPKDALKSFYQATSNFTDPRWLFKGTWDQFFELQLMGEYTWGGWFEHSLALEKAMRDHPTHPIYIHQYEEMIKDPLGSVQKLCRFLEMPEKMAQDIVDATDVTKMKANDNNNRENESFFRKTDHSLIGKGGIGGWKKCFTVAQSERFNKHFEEKMAGTKIGDLVRPYI